MNYSVDKTVGKNIKRLRNQRNYSQNTLSIKLQNNGYYLSRSDISKIEIGKRHIYAQDIYHIKNALNTTYDELFKSDENLELYLEYLLEEQKL